MSDGFGDLTTAGWIHTVLSSVGILVGAEQLLRTRRDRLHRQLGYVYAVSMLFADVTILTVYRFNGHFNVFHVGAIVNMGTIAMALRPMLAKPRPQQWRIKHYLWISWSYVGLLAAAVTEFFIRTQPLGAGNPIAATALASTLVVVVGAVLIRRHQPMRAAR